MAEPLPFEATQVQDVVVDFTPISALRLLSCFDGGGQSQKLKCIPLHVGHPCGIPVHARRRTLASRLPHWALSFIFLKNYLFT